jgi:hypothetical protein
MKNVRITKEMKVRLKERFGLSVSDLNPSTMTLWCRGNVKYCPYVTVTRKLMSAEKNAFFLVDEKLNLMISGLKLENRTPLTTSMYLNGKEGNVNLI